MKKKFYSLDNNLSVDANYRILLSERNVGKSYALKKYVLENVFNSDFEKKFVYLRRYDKDIKQTLCDRYFADIPVDQITKKKYEGVMFFRGDFYFYTRDPKTYKPVKGPHIGYALALTAAEHHKSLVFPKVEDIVYEEFITTSLYLPDEPTKLQELVSTVARERDVNVWLLGNKIDRVCPYFTEWELTGTMSQKAGTIDTYKYTHTKADGTKGETIVTVEQCSVAGSNSTMFFGSAAKSIMGGEWATKEKPHLPKPLEEYTQLYQCCLRDCGFEFMMNLLVDESDGGVFMYVYPKTTKWRYIARIITNDFSTNPLTTTTFNDRIRAEVKMRECIRNGKVCYSDNLTGTDFEKVLASRKGVL